MKKLMISIILISGLAALVPTSIYSMDKLGIKISIMPGQRPFVLGMLGWCTFWGITLHRSSERIKYLLSELDEMKCSDLKSQWIDLSNDVANSKNPKDLIVFERKAFQKYWHCKQKHASAKNYKNM